MFCRDISGFILAGGRSSRMGREKARIPWGEGTLLTHAVEQMGAVTDRVFIVGGTEADNPPAPLITDVFKGCGPLGGIHAALTASGTVWNLVLAIDLPLIDTALLRFLSETARGSEAHAVVPRVGGQLQPLCSVYHAKMQSPCEQALRTQRFHIHGLFQKVRTRIIEEQELAIAGFPAEMFLNVNTPEDVVRARSARGRP